MKIHLLCFVSSLFFALGVFLPCLEVDPQYGSFTGAVKILSPEYGEKKVFSIVSGIFDLLSEGELFIGFILLFFSLVFPLLKLSVLWSVHASRVGGEVPGRTLELLSHLGKFSMLDIFVIALLVLVLKGMPGGTEVKLLPGVVFFALSVLLAIVAKIKVVN